MARFCCAIYGSLIGLNLDKSDVLAKANDMYEKLQSAGIEVLFDDRDVSAGEKFADSDLIGIPYRVIVSAKTAGKVEVKRRDSSEARMLEVEELMNELKK